MLNIRFRERTNTWPGFVDLFSNLVIILIFLLILLVFLWTTTGLFNKRKTARAMSELQQANAEQMEQIQKMSADEKEAKRLLILARTALEDLESSNAQLTDELNEMDMSVEELVSSYEARVAELQEHDAQMQAAIAALQVQFEQTSTEAAQRRELQEQMQAQRDRLAEQIAELQAALTAAEEKSAAQEIEYVEMSARLNKALADKVAELKNVQSYQSAFYKAVKDALGDRTTLQPDGDRFIVSSDILFSSGSYKLSPEGKNQLRLIANVIKDMENKIPSDVNWIIRVDGHTDKKPVVPGTRGYSNNTELSLRRATAVADELAAAGVSKRRLVPSGFGDMHPVELGNSPEALQKNRRIELQLTNR